MRLRATLLYAFAIVLTAFYLVVAYVALHPHVSSEYKAFYIDRTAKQWTPTQKP